MAQKVHIITPENIRLEYEIAGLGTRAIALLVDSLIQLAIVAVLGGVYVSLGTEALRGEAGLARVSQSGWFTAVLLIAAYAGYQGYFLAFEAAARGQTPGKRAARVRVIMDDGRALTFRAALLRNVLRLADFLPMAYFAGMIAAFANSSSKRIGDLAAGTVVVKVRPAPLPSGSAAARREVRLGLPQQQRAADLPVSDVQAIRQFLERRQSLPRSVVSRLASELTARIAPLIGMPAHEAGSNPEGVLEDILTVWDERRRA